MFSGEKKIRRHGKFYLFGQLSTADGKIFREINTKFGKARVCVLAVASDLMQQKNQSKIK